MDSAKQSVTPISIEASSEQEQLSEWEHAVIELFVHTAQMIGLPKSVGQIYGLLFCSEAALPMDTIMQRLGISKGSASQGLKALRQLNAVKMVFRMGDRRDHFEAEMALRSLVSGFLSDQVKPGLQSGNHRLAHIASLSENAPEAERQRAMDRLDTLRTWHSKTDKLLPLVQKII